MNPMMQYKVLTTAYSRAHLLDQGKKNGVDWEEDKQNEGINWLRFSTALIKFFKAGNSFYTDDSDAESLQLMLNNYKSIRELHKRTMIPLVRAAMSKLASNTGTHVVRPMELLPEAYKHLDNYGGQDWSNKVSTLVQLNNSIKYLTKRLGLEQDEQEEDTVDTNGGETRRIQ